MHALEKAWAEFEPTGSAKILPGDDVLLQPELAGHVALYRTWVDFIHQRDFGARDTRLHLSLLPAPFFGPLSSASVFVLTLNPGLHPSDYFSEYFIPEYREARCRAMRQQLDERFPFIWFDPRFSWHPGHSYWHGRFRQLVDTFTRDTDIPRLEALAFFASQVAVLELVPYHSAVFGLSRKILDRLRSVDLARSFVSEVVIPRVLSDEASVVAVRQAPMWNLPRHPNAIAYGRSERRGAYLTPETQGGEAILKRLKEAWNRGHSLP